MPGMRQSEIVAKFMSKHQAAEEGRIGVAPGATAAGIAVGTIGHPVAIEIQTKVSHMPRNVGDTGVGCIAPTAAGRPALDDAPSGEAI
jgi:hypothetical protein